MSPEGTEVTSPTEDLGSVWHGAFRPSCCRESPCHFILVYVDNSWRTTVSAGVIPHGSVAKSGYRANALSDTSTS
jgi:hypothetical protein